MYIERMMNETTVAGKQQVLQTLAEIRATGKYVPPEWPEQLKQGTSEPRPAVTKPATPDTVLVLRTCLSDMTSHGGFRWPASGPVEAPDWSPVASCGNGLHGWLWGAGNWGLKTKGENIKWLVVEVEKSLIVDLRDKVKFPRGIVVACVEHWRDAMAVISRRLADGGCGHVFKVSNRYTVGVRVLPEEGSHA